MEGSTDLVLHLPYHVEVRHARLHHQHVRALLHVTILSKKQNKKGTNSTLIQFHFLVKNHYGEKCESKNKE